VLLLLLLLLLDGVLCVIDIGSERVLDLSQPLHSQIVSRCIGKRPAVYLRYDEPNPMGGFIRIYPKGLRYNYTIISIVTVVYPSTILLFIRTSLYEIISVCDIISIY